MPAGRPRATKEHLKISGIDKTDSKYENYGSSALVAFSKDTKMIEAPAGLSKKSKDAWDLTIPCLLNMGVLGPLDIPLLEQGFFNLDECYKALKAIKDFDKRYKDEPIEVVIKKRQQLRAWYSQSLSDSVKIFSRFGISPEARSHLTLTPQSTENEDPLDVLLEGN